MADGCKGKGGKLAARVQHLESAWTTWRTDTLSKLSAKLFSVIPISIFFIVLFWMIVPIFGIRHVMPVSCYTVLFRMRYRKYNPPSQYLRFFTMSFIALGAARVATFNWMTSIVVNIVMSFAFVFMRSSQLNPRRYIPYTMLFVFFQLRPELLDDMALEAALVVACCTTLSVAIAVMNIATKAGEANLAKLHGMVERLADALDHMADIGITADTRKELLSLRSDYSKLAYTVRENASVQPAVANLYDMFAMLAQRTAYLVGRLECREQQTCPHPPYLHELAGLTRQAGGVLDKKGGDEAAARAQALLAKADTIDNERYRLFFRSYLHMILLVLRDARHPRSHAWRVSPLTRLRLMSFRKHLTLDSFELRFAVRCAAVLAITCTTSLLSPVNHLYWFPLTSFMLLRPSPDETVRRMRSRTVGTVLGCLVVHGISMLKLPLAAVIVVDMLFVAGRYMGTPGSAPTAFFGTAYAISMASMSIGDHYAIRMRLICLAAGVLLVFVINRLVMPTSDRTLFLANVHEGFGLIARYWGLLRFALHERVDTVTSSEELLHIQMIHTQAMAYARALPEDTPAEREQRKDIVRVLFCQWGLVCEMEQLSFLIRLHAFGADTCPKLEQFMQAAQESCDPFVVDGPLDAAKELVAGIAEEDLRYVLEQYLKRADTLAVAAAKVPELVSGRPGYREEVAEVK